MTTALITGGLGFIGSHLSEKLLKEGAEVLVVDNLCTGSPGNADVLRAAAGTSGKLKILNADVSQPWNTWLKKEHTFAKPFTHIFHFASPASPPLYQKLALETMLVNSMGLLEGIQFANAQKARLIFASTSEIYGDPAVHPQPETYLGNVNTVGPRSCYDEAKRFGEALVHTLNIKNQSAHGIVRIFNTYGPRMNPRDGRVVINFLCQALRGDPLTVYGQGQQTRSFCYVDDLADGILAFARSKELGPINLGNDREFTILELAETVQQLFPQKKLRLEFADLPVDDPKQRRPDLKLARSLLRWDAKVPLKEGLRRMAEWLEKEKLD